MHAGHTPAEIESMPAWDFQLYLEALPVIQAHENPFAAFDDE